MIAAIRKIKGQKETGKYRGRLLGVLQVGFSRSWIFMKIQTHFLDIFMKIQIIMKIFQENPVDFHENPVD